MYNKDDVTRFAAAALEGALDIAIDYATDPQCDVPGGLSDEKLRANATMFAEDIMNDLREEVLEAIKTMKFRKQITARIVPCDK